MGYYYNLDNNTEPSKAPQDINDKAKTLLSGDFMSRISNINRESVAGGVGLGLVGYIFSRVKEKNVFVYTIGGVVVGFVLFNILFRATGGNKQAKQIIDDEIKKQGKFANIKNNQAGQGTETGIRPQTGGGLKAGEGQQINNLKQQLNGVKIIK